MDGSVGKRMNLWLANRPGVRSAVRSGVQTANAPFAKARFRRSADAAGRPFKLEIGGRAPRDGWLVTNVSAFTRFYMDATTSWPLNDDCLEYVFSDNVIEHLTLPQARRMLHEAKRCLQSGGVLRTVTPDLRAHIDMYLAGESQLANAVSNHYREIGMTVEYPVDLVRIPVAAFGHHAGYIFDFDTLATELDRAGFKNIVRCELGESEHPSLRRLDLRGNEGGAQLAVEATA